MAHGIVAVYMAYVCIYYVVVHGTWCVIGVREGYVLGVREDEHMAQTMCHVHATSYSMYMVYVHCMRAYNVHIPCT